MSGRIGRIFFTFLLAITASASFSQDSKLGTWRMYLPYGVSKSMCDAGDKLYCAAAQSFFSYEKATGIIQTYDKASGLSDIGIKVLNYDPATKVLVVAYSNSNIDLIYNGTDVYNISDIQKKAITGAININGVSFYNGDAYISTDMGISVINLAKKEISNTYIIGAGGVPVRVYATTIDGTNIYAATEGGVKYASLNAGNLLDFNSWTLFTASQGLPTKRSSFITAYNNKVYAVINGTSNSDTLYAYSGAGWSKVFYDTMSTTLHSLDVVNNTLYFGIWDDAPFAGRVGKIEAAGIPVVRKVVGHGRPLNWFETDNVAWESDFFTGLYKYVDGESQPIAPDGPYSSSVFRLNVTNSVVSVAAGGVDDSWGFTYNQSYFYTYQGNRWTSFNQYNHSEMAEYMDILCAANIPERGKSYFGSFYAGLVEVDHWQNDKLTFYNKYNSILEGAIGDTGRTKISCLYADRNNNLWIGNAGAPNLLKVIKSDGTWAQFNMGLPISLFKNMIVDQYNQVWALTRQSNGVMVFGFGGDVNNPNLDVPARLLTTTPGKGNLPDENVFSLAEDLDGNIWIGTNQGIGIYYCGSNVLDGTCDADQIKVVAADGYVGYLFGTESVRAIAVDAANRKWIGTTNGAWLISADGKEQLLNFNASNSPMPSNQVTDIAIDHNTGEVFIGTLGGLVSYQGDATGPCADCGKNALVYPNPVRHDYDGPIAIKGLYSNAQVKITDVNGNVIYAGKANGTQMVWDGKNYKGERAQSGVYLVFSSGDLGEEKKVAKILVMN